LEHTVLPQTKFVEQHRYMFDHIIHDFPETTRKLDEMERKEHDFEHRR